MLIRRYPSKGASFRDVLLNMPGAEDYYVGKINVDIGKIPRSPEDLLELVFGYNNTDRDIPIVYREWSEKSGRLPIYRDHPGGKTHITGWFISEFRQMAGQVPDVEDYVLVYDPKTRRIILAKVLSLGWDIVFDSENGETYERSIEGVNARQVAMKYLETMKSLIKRYSK